VGNANVACIRYQHVAHLVRNKFRLASRRDRGKIAKGPHPVYTTVNEADAAVHLAEFVPFLDHSPEIRRMTGSTVPSH